MRACRPYICMVLPPPPSARCRSIRHGTRVHACAWYARPAAPRACESMKVAAAICNLPRSDRHRSRINTGIIQIEVKYFYAAKADRIGRTCSHFPSASASGVARARLPDFLLLFSSTGKDPTISLDSPTTHSLPLFRRPLFRRSFRFRLPAVLPMKTALEITSARGLNSDEVTEKRESGNHIETRCVTLHEVKKLTTRLFTSVQSSLYNSG